ncbi:MAG: hypothetical protein JNM68_07585, partial [Dinghuibacter sp.]|nr:hypothetical protein [Dinghuibacter sp.]
MKAIRLLALFIMLGIGAIAQKKTLTLDDAMLRTRTTFNPQNLSQLQFLYGTGDYVYLKTADGRSAWMKGNFKSKEETVFLTLDMLNEQLQKAGLKKAEQMPAIQFGQGSNWIMNLHGAKISLNPVSGQATTLLDKNFATKENAEESRAGHTAYL